MRSRMERYQEITDDVIKKDISSRTVKNSQLYHDIDKTELSRVKTSSNVRVIDEHPKEINLEKIKNYIQKMNDERPVTRRVVVSENATTEVVKEEPKEVEKKVYDINSVLEKAKEGREVNYEEEKYKKLRDTQFDILSKIKMYEEEEKEKKEEMLTLEDTFNTDERTLIDLINTVTVKKNEESLLSELLGGEGEQVTAPIEEELSNTNSLELEKVVDDSLKDNKEEVKQEFKEVIKEEPVKEETKQDNSLEQISQKIDKSFYTNSMSFSKEDFETFEEIEKAVKKNNVFVKISLILLILVVIVTIVVIANYVFELGLF